MSIKCLTASKNASYQWRLLLTTGNSFVFCEKNQGTWPFGHVPCYPRSDVAAAEAGFALGSRARLIHCPFGGAANCFYAAAHAVTTLPQRVAG